MIKIAVIGTGTIAPSHQRGYATFGNQCEIVALCDIKPEKALKARETWGLGDIPVFDDHQKLLAEMDVDLVSVCTPPYTHAEISINAMRAGSHVLCEKPMASSLEECDAMNAAQHETGKSLSVIAQNRFTEDYWKMKQLLTSGMVGKVNHIRIDSHWWRGANYYDLWWRGTWEKEGGGCTLNHAVHHIDIGLWMVGKPSQVRAVMGNTSHPNSEVEDISAALLSYPNGAIGQLTSSVIHYGEHKSIEIQAEKARIAAPFVTTASTPRRNGFPEANAELEKEVETYWNQAEVPEYTGHTGQIQNVLTALEQNQKPLVTGEDGRNALELITAIYLAGTTDQTVELPLTSDCMFYTTQGLLKNAPRFNKKTRVTEDFGDDKITV